ncbi:hypothetical protein M436DRAFT_51045 [Aureobasidium namibiae CBS 147.97]|uniref:GIT Spa2 homology (SHD) domain-containing protein n=1 Tax=Aureobasidium namibiae CBS 147.97 TaxID=1043004 RepID=A0A074WE86_9PEZI|nr:uncharacterized protein M436DRAFT_51045 [Aureobasidium namibiae CBS 147.97]KEQ71415.1 hypothetical protein M436DRAFT_51045 [Aureobasidium namibiae CBS 147.97]
MHAPNRSRDDSLSGRGYQGPPLAHDPYAAAASRTAVPIQNSPPLSQGSTDNSLSSRAHSRRSPSATNSHLSSSSSVSGGPGLYSPAASEFRRQSVKSNNQEAALAHHYSVLKVYLAPYLRDEQGNTRPTRARDKLLRLSPTQFNELSTDVFDELQRREDDRRRPGGIVPPSLPPRNIFHPKRNQARQKLSTLPPERFRQLATDVFFELGSRMPNLLGPDGDRPASPTGSVASRVSSRQHPPYAMRRPSGQQNGMRGPPPAGIRPGPPSNGPPSSSFGRPLPQTFQSNTMVPNKSTMVEDDETDEDDDETYGLGQVSGTSEKDAETMRAFEHQVSELEAKIADLEAKLHDKDAEIETHKQDHSRDRNEWSQTREEHDLKMVESQKTLDTLHAELEHTRADRDQSESNLRAHTEQAMLRANATSAKSLDHDNDWQQRYKELEQELLQHRKTTAEVRLTAEQHLQEMRLLSEQSETAMEREEELQSRIAALEVENEQWRIRYAKTKTQLRTLKASSIGLSMEHMAARALSSKHEHIKSNGLVKDMDVTNFQISIDELLQAARDGSSARHSALDKAKAVVLSVRNMTSAVDGSFSNLGSPHSSTTHLSQSTMGPTPEKLKARVSRDANNLVTVTRNHAAAKGLAPISLVDAAASNLTTSVVEFVKVVGVRDTQNDSDDDSSIDGEDIEIEEIAPLSMTGNKPVVLKAPVPPQKQQAGTGWFSMLKGPKSEHSDDEDEYDFS